MGLGRWADRMAGGCHRYIVRFGLVCGNVVEPVLWLIRGLKCLGVVSQRRILWLFSGHEYLSSQ